MKFGFAFVRNWGVARAGMVADLIYTSKFISRSNFRLPAWSGGMLLLFAVGLSPTVHAQVNSWTKPSSGNWEESVWSLGTLPGAGQSIMITNEGWKAVAIGANTAQNYPQSLNVNSGLITAFSTKPVETIPRASSILKQGVNTTFTAARSPR
jgi:hypothetical protein